MGEAELKEGGRGPILRQKNLKAKELENIGGSINVDSEIKVDG